MNTSTFKKNLMIATKTKDLILSLEPLLENIPKKDLFSRDKIKDTCISLLESIYHANIIKKDLKRRLSYQEDAIIYLRVIDFHIERLYKLRYISKRQVLTISSKIEDIYKMIYGWIKSSEN